MLDKLTVDDFKPTVGETFKLDLDGEGTLDLEVLEAETQGGDGAPTTASGTRAPFHVHFRGPAEPILAQRIYRLEHAALGPLEIFVVPIGRDTDGTVYEAVFA